MHIPLIPIITKEKMHSKSSEDDSPKYSSPKIAHHANLNPSLNSTIDSQNHGFVCSSKSICNPWFSMMMNYS